MSVLENPHVDTDALLGVLGLLRWAVQGFDAEGCVSLFQSLHDDDAERTASRDIGADDGSGGPPQEGDDRRLKEVAEQQTDDSVAVNEAGGAFETEAERVAEQMKSNLQDIASVEQADDGRLRPELTDEAREERVRE